MALTPLSRRRFLCTMALGAVGAAVSTACAPATPTPETAKPATPAPSGKIVIRFMSRGGQSYLAILQELAKKFEAANPKYQIKFEHAEGTMEEVNVKFQTQMAAGTIPDVIFIDGLTFRPFAARGMLHDLEPYAQRDLNKADYFEFALDALRYQGRLYATPYDGGLYVMFYNKDLFDKAGLKYPTAEWTWDTLVESARKLTVDQNGKRPGEPGFDPLKMAQYGLNNITWHGGLSLFIYQNGGDVLSEDKRRVVLDQPPAYEALQWIADLMNKHYVSPSPQYQQAQPMTFTNGRIAMAIMGSWGLGGVRREAKDFKWDVAPVPQGKKKVTVGWASGMAIPKATKIPDDAWQWARYLASEDGQREIMKLGTATPPFVKKIALSDEFLKDTPPDSKRVFIDEAQYLRLPAFMYIVESIEFAREWNTALDAVWLGKKTAAEAMREVTPKLTEIVQRDPGAAKLPAEQYQKK